MWIFHIFGDILQPLEFVPASREGVVATESQVRSVLGEYIEGKSGFNSSATVSAICAEQ